MKRAIVKDLNESTRLISLGQSLHVLHPTGEKTEQFSKYTVAKSQKFESNIRFDLTADRKGLLVIDDQSKALRLHSSADISLVAQTWLKKKLTDVTSVSAVIAGKPIEGALVSDRVGEVKFITIEKLAADGVKGAPEVNVAEQEEREEEVPKTLFGQQQETVAIAVSKDGKTLIAIDTLNRIRISEWPNVFSIRHMIVQHKNRITDYTFFGDSKLATYSALDNHLLITDILSGTVNYSSKEAHPEATIEGITEAKDSKLVMLLVGKESLEYSLVCCTGETLISGLKVKEGERYLLSDGRLIKVTTREGESVEGVEIADLV